MKAAADAFFLGVDGLKWLAEEDPAIVMTTQAVVNRLGELHKRDQQNLAHHIADKVGQLFKKGKK